MRGRKMANFKRVLCHFCVVILVIFFIAVDFSDSATSRGTRITRSRSVGSARRARRIAPISRRSRKISSRTISPIGRRTAGRTPLPLATRRASSFSRTTPSPFYGRTVYPRSRTTPRPVSRRTFYPLSRTTPWPVSRRKLSPISGSPTISAPWMAYHGGRNYMRRSRYHKGDAPEICENYEWKDEQGMPLGKFVCPLLDLPDDYIYCCGDAGRQRCCTFFDNPGKTAGVVIGILLFFGIVGVILFCCCRRYNTRCRTHKTMKDTTYPENNEIHTIAQPADVCPLPGDKVHQSKEDPMEMPPPYHEHTAYSPYSPNPTAMTAGQPCLPPPYPETQSDV